VDRNQLQQVVMNLAVNARDAMPTGGSLHLEVADVQITAAQASSHPNAAPGWYVLLKVRDTGLGMNAETLSQAFEPFFTTKPVGQGTGLGLSMVYGFVSQSGGFVEVDSQPDKGTELRLYLPRVDEPVTSRRPAEEDLPAEPRSGAGTILVVEDEERVETLITRVLTQCGYHVLSARNTPDAIKLADKCTRQPDLLITDVVMPGQSGLELTSLLRKDWPDLKVLFISGYAHDVLRSRGQGHIEGDFLSKPFTPESLSAKVAEILDLPS
jgi:CheY-like chemotaxis protein